ncbi:MAG: hypothetical protein WBD46_02320 [Acidobacteriaceae bacterium]
MTIAKPIRRIAAGFPGMPWLKNQHHEHDAHALASVIVVVAIVVLVGWAFRRRSG